MYILSCFIRKKNLLQVSFKIKFNNIIEIIKKNFRFSKNKYGFTPILHLSYEEQRPINQFKG